MATKIHRSPIQQFFNGANIFITGATGFLGTLLVEKLLRSCSDVSTIYVLVRDKKGKNLEKRIDEYFEDCVFDRVKKEFPKFLHKIVGIRGDCNLPDLGLSLQDRQMLINKVSVVFHVAATVSFDEKLKRAVLINVRATRDVLKLAREMQNLKALVHVSTVYSNAPNAVIEEKFYPSPVDAERMIVLAETTTDDYMDKITNTLLGKWPNTYTYTKALAEDIARQYGQNLPLGVFRPSVVVSTYLEPIQAWVNSLNGPSGIAVASAAGVMRVMCTDGKGIANLVPADMCVNTLIATAWDVSEKFETSKTGPKFQTPIYHYESSTEQPIEWVTFLNLSLTQGFKTPPLRSVWYYSFFWVPNKFVFWVAILVLHYLPGLLIDGVLLCRAKSPIMLSTYKKIHKLINVFAYFTSRSWIFISQNVNEMSARMTEDDRKIFFCDLKKLSWHEYCNSYFLGVRTYLMRDPVDTINDALVRYKRLYYLHVLLKVTICFVVIRIGWWLISVLFKP